MEGFLSKRSGRSGAIGFWQRRHFVLESQYITYSTVGPQGRLETRGRIDWREIACVRLSGTATNNGTAPASTPSTCGANSNSSVGTAPAINPFKNALSASAQAIMHMGDRRGFFEIVTRQGRIYFLQASNGALAERWVAAIQQGLEAFLGDMEIRKVRLEQQNRQQHSDQNMTVPLLPLLPVPSAPPFVGPSSAAVQDTPAVKRTAIPDSDSKSNSTYGEYLSFHRSVDYENSDESEEVDDRPGTGGSAALNSWESSARDSALFSLSCPQSGPDGSEDTNVLGNHPTEDITLSDGERQVLKFVEDGMGIYLAAMVDACEILASSFATDQPNARKTLACALLCLKQLQYDNIEACEHLPPSTSAFLLATGERGGLGDALWAVIAQCQHAVLQCWIQEGPSVVARMDSFLSRRQRERRERPTSELTAEQLFLRGDPESVAARVMAVIDMIQQQFLQPDGSSNVEMTKGRTAVSNASALCIIRAREFLAERPSYFFPASLCAKLGFIPGNGSGTLLVLTSRNDGPIEQRVLRQLFRCSLVFQQLQLENDKQKSFRGYPNLVAELGMVATVIQHTLSPDHTSLDGVTATELARVASSARALEMGIFASWQTREGGASTLLVDGRAGGLCMTECCASTTDKMKVVRRFVLLQKNVRILKRLSVDMSGAALRPIQDALLQCAAAVDKALPSSFAARHNMERECRDLLKNSTSE